ncbi:MAG: hypothetical protein JWR70_1520 [Modestobacter sp.]|jgi:hypothetical protein|nr:hypothetical protein [Modestobacter sp.]
MSATQRGGPSGVDVEHGQPAGTQGQQRVGDRGTGSTGTQQHQPVHRHVGQAAVKAQAKPAQSVLCPTARRRLADRR